MKPSQIWHFLLYFHCEGYRKVCAKLRFAGLPPRKIGCIGWCSCAIFKRRAGGESSFGQKAHDARFSPSRSVSCGAPMRSRRSPLQMDKPISLSTLVIPPLSSRDSIRWLWAIVSRNWSRLIKASDSTLEFTQKKIANGLLLRNPHGPPYMADNFQSELTFLSNWAHAQLHREIQGNSRPSVSSVCSKRICCGWKPLRPLGSSGKL